MAERKGFSFLKSYYEMLKRLPDDESKVAYIEAICEKQFEGVEPTIEGMAEFAYASQKHNIDKSRKGWEDVQKRTTIVTPSVDPSEGGSGSPSVDPSEQEKEEEEVQEKEKEQTREEKFLGWFNDQKEKHTGKKGKFKVLSKTDTSNLKKLLDTYSHDDFKEAIPNLFKSEWARTHNGFSPSHFLRIDNFNKYLNQSEESETKVVDPMVEYVKQIEAKYGYSNEG